MQAVTHSTRPGGLRPAHAVANGLGWFSIGLGLAEWLMPHTMARAVGLAGKEGLVRAFGVREVLTGVGILMARDPEPWIWGRVAGDALDLTALASGLRADNPQRVGSAVAMLAVAQVTVMDIACANALAGYREQASHAGIDYSERRGFSKSAQAMRGAALSDFTAPDDFRIPEALTPWEQKSLPGRESRASS